MLQKFTISWYPFDTHFSLYPFLSHPPQPWRNTASLPLCRSVLHIRRAVIARFQDLWSFLLLSSAFRAFRAYPTGTEDFWSLRTIWSGSWCQILACYKLFTCVHCSTEQRHQYLASTSGHPYKALNRFSTSKPQRNLTENLETVNFPSISVLDHGAFISKYLLPLSNLPHANGA